VKIKINLRMYIGRLLGAYVVALGLVSLLGWAIDRDVVAVLFPGHAALKVNSAVCFAALGLVTLLPGEERQRLRRTLEVSAGIIAAATIVEHLWRISFGIDQLVFDDPFTKTGAPGRMTLGAAIAFALIAGGMFGLDSTRRRVRAAAQAPLFCAGAIGLIALVGYASGLGDLYWQSDVTVMAIHTAIGILLLVASVVVLAPVEGAIAVVLRPSPGGRLLRRMVPAAVLVPAAFVVPIGRGAGAGYFGFDVGVLLFLIGIVTVSLPVLVWTARSLDAAEARARADSERFSSVLRAATEHSIIGTDVQGVITVFNEGAERMLGYAAEEVVGRATPLLIHDPKEVAARAAELRIAPGFDVLVGAARRNEAETREWTFVRKDGSRVPVSLTVTALRASDGSQSGFMGMAFDLSGRKELERELRRQADFTGTLVGSAPVGIYATDAAGKWVFVNAKWQELAALTEEEARGDGWVNALHPDDTASVGEAWSALARDGEPFALEYRFRRPDGTIVWVGDRAVAVHGEYSEIVGYLGTIVDITESRAAEAQRERLLAESRAVLDASTDGILMTDLAGEVLFSNAAMGSFWDDTGLDGVGTIWDRLAGLSQLTTSPDEYHRLLEAVSVHPEREHVGEITLSATGRSFVGRTAPVRRADGKLMGRIFSLRETTTERAADRAKGEFVATVSHELRTPLAAISGYAELLEEEVTSLSDEGAQFLAVVQRNADRLTRLVDDLLLLQQAEADGISIDPSDVELSELVRQSIERVEPAASRKGIRIDTEGEGRLVVSGDAMRLGQILDNLLSNAVKFTPEHGTVNVRVNQLRGACAVEVADSGPGIPHDEQGRLFERFFRSREAVARSIPGTGLGLVVSRRIAEAHGGALELMESNGSGATFRLLLPAAVSLALVD
jgi:PAS domain S-box-containing protein